MLYRCIAEISDQVDDNRSVPVGASTFELQRSVISSTIIDRWVLYHRVAEIRDHIDDIGLVGD